MRIRQVKPSYFKDARIAALAPGVRLTYIGLWMLADDGGYYRWDVAEAGLELYGYESRTKRERDVTNHLAALVEAGRVVDFGCGHILIPHLVTHQRLAGPTKRVLTYEREHVRCAPPRVSPQVPAGITHLPDTVRNGQERDVEQESERNGTGTVGGRKRLDDEEETEFRSRVPRPGAA